MKDIYFRHILQGHTAGHSTPQLHMCMEGMLDHLPVVGSYSSALESTVSFLSTPPTTIIFPFNTAAAHPLRAFFMEGKADHCPDVVSYCSADESP
mmetsp:Transcript_7364/g.11086  ORF Transcript_7364/g.11086 Transcript_7364/m.11086 type:complete len:95 (-) Transcript_7364:69-353(-)